MSMSATPSQARSTRSITIDAAFADRLSVVQSSIPIVAVPVPEASALAMMLSGLGLLGCATARRRRA